MEAKFWNDRYGADAYAYGTEPNDFLKQQTVKPGSKVLCIADGEGRNGVYLATCGCEVHSVDYSVSGKAKAEQLAASKGVKIDYTVADLRDFDPGENAWDLIVSVFAHLQPSIRERLHAGFYKALKPGGRLILEAYRPEQIDYGTGGPKDKSMMYDEVTMRNDFGMFEKLNIECTEREVREGEFHNGRSAVIRVIAEKAG